MGFQSPIKMNIWKDKYIFQTKKKFGYLNDHEEVISLFSLYNNLLTVVELDWLESIGYCQVLPYVKVFYKRTTDQDWQTFFKNRQLGNLCSLFMSFIFIFKQHSTIVSVVWNNINLRSTRRSFLEGYDSLMHVYTWKQSLI